MAAYSNNSTSKRAVSTVAIRDAKNALQVEQKAAHIELLLRKLYAKVDELETVCKEEKEFHALLKRKGRKNIPKYDSQLLPRVVSSQQRCAEAAFNNLDLYKWNLLRSSGRKSTLSLPVQADKPRSSNDFANSHHGDTRWSSSVSSSNNIKQADVSPVQRSGTSSIKDSSWYGSLDRNMKKKKRGYLDRSRRHTKTVGSLAGLNVENIDMLQPDEQYTFGLPTVEPPKFHAKLPVIEAGLSPPPLLHAAVRSNPVTTISVLPDHQDVRINWQLPPSHSYSRSQPVPVFPASSSEREHPRWLESSVDTVDSALGSTEVLPPPGHDSSASTDFNFNRLAISSPTQASERSSRSSENGDSKISYVNESSKPFEMSDYYKYSTKYRGQRKEQVAGPKQKPPSSHRSNGVSHSLPEVNMLSRQGDEQPPFSRDDVRPNKVQERVPEIPDDPEPVPKLPPKLRPLTMSAVSGPNNNRLPQRSKASNADLVNGNLGDSSQTAWVQTTPTIV